MSEYGPPPPDGTLCNRTACRAPNATWWNTSTRAWYCGPCAVKIFIANGSRDGLLLPTEATLRHKDGTHCEGGHDRPCFRAHIDRDLLATAMAKNDLFCPRHGRRSRPIEVPGLACDDDCWTKHDPPQ